jgi:M6 family metalloprotease-like protein
MKCGGPDPGPGSVDSAPPAPSVRPVACGGIRAFVNPLRHLRLSLVFVLLLELRAMALPNLVPYKPSTWSDRIVVSTTTGTTTDSPALGSTDQLYVDLAVSNVGADPTSGRLETELYVDGQYRGRWYREDPLAAGYHIWKSDYSIGHLGEGTHTLEVRVDPRGLITESDETDNNYTKTIVILDTPNLVPFQPPAWSDKIVVSTLPGTSSDSAAYLPTDTLHVDLAVLNEGPAAANDPFFVDLYVDGELRGYWQVTPPLPADTYVYVTDHSIGSLKPGLHDVAVVADSTSTVPERDESDNVHIKTILVTGPPNLVPYQPRDWSDRIVLSSGPGTSTDGTRLDSAEVLYLDWAVLNEGGENITVPFAIELYVDEVLHNTWIVDPPLEPGYYVFERDHPIGPLAPGDHTIRIKADSGGLVSEGDELDNEYAKTVPVGHHPNLTVFQPPGWTDALVFSRVPGTTTESEVLLSTDTLFLDWAVTNRGSGPATTRFVTELYIDDVLQANWPIESSFAASRAGTVIDHPLGSLPAGFHFVEIRVDTGDSILESNEDDNSYFTFLWVYPDDPERPPDIRVEPSSLPAAAASASPAGSPPVPSPLPAPKPAARLVPTDTRLRGMPASPDPFTAVQPDGSAITLRLRGSIRYHWLEDEGGFTVVRQGRTFVYAMRDAAGSLGPTPWVVGRDDPIAVGLTPHERPTREGIALANLHAAPESPTADTPPGVIAPNGTIDNVVILMRFSNHAERTLPSPADYDRIFNAPGGDPVLAPTGSVRDFYLENSYGAMSLRSTVFAWVTLPNTETYYADEQSGRSARIKEAIRDALDLADAQIDFGRFDANSDGYVDAITFIHSGYAAEALGTAIDGSEISDRIWSHRWTIPAWTSGEGIKVSNYHINPGLWGISGSSPTRIGVVCHETGHFFGLPDLYDTEGDGNGVGSYDLMGNAWGFTGDQRHPPHFGAWSKVFLGWVTPTIVATPGTYVAPQVETSPTVFRIDLGYPSGEYLLIENREPTGFESTLPQGGLAIWHIDESRPSNDDEGYPGQRGWPENDRHYRVALLQADGYYDLEQPWGNRGDAWDLFHGADVSELSMLTSPNTDAYQGGKVILTGNRIHDVSEAGESMSFTFSVEPPTNRFRIANSGSSTLRVDSITSDTPAPWLAVSPVPPYGLLPGEELWVTVSIDPTLAPVGTNSTRLLIASNDPDENPFPTGVTVAVTREPPPCARIVGRLVFYNHSGWDAGDPLPSVRDDDAIATDKTALLPGNTATFANYTSFSRGLNGIMVDIADLAGTPGVADFVFRTGNDNNVEAWPLAPGPPQVTLRPKQGTEGSDRVTLIWPDQAIRKCWLQVVVLATPETGLAAPDVFYFGNAPGETGNSATDARVTSADALRVLRNPAANAPITSPFDHNRDGRVGAADRLTILGNLSALGPLTLLNLGGTSVRMADRLPAGSPVRDWTVHRVDSGLSVRWSAQDGPVRIWTSETVNGADWEIYAESDADRLADGTLEVILPVDPQGNVRFYRVETLDSR